MSHERTGVRASRRGSCVLAAATIAGCVALGACKRDPGGLAAASSGPSAPAAPAPAPSVSGVAPVGSAPPPPPIIGVLAWELPIDRRRFVVVMPTPGRTATLFNEKLGEWLSLQAETEGDGAADTVKLEAASGALHLSIPVVGPGTVTLGHGKPISVAAKRVTLAAPRDAPREFPTLHGGLLDVAAKESRLVQIGSLSLAWDGVWLPATGSVPVAPKIRMGRAVIAPEQLTARTVGRCSVRGAAPGAEGPLGEALTAAWMGEVQALCADRSDDAVVEASYGVVRFVGVNRLDDSRDPGPTDVLALNLALRVTGSGGSTIAESGFLVGLAKGEVVSLRSLLAPTGAAFLEQEARSALAFPAGMLAPADRTLLLDVSRASLTVGVSTVDVVVPTEPWGVLLPSRHVMLGPRSTVASAFLPGRLTQRMLAMVNVDY